MTPRFRTAGFQPAVSSAPSAVSFRQAALVLALVFLGAALIVFAIHFALVRLLEVLP